MRRVTAIIKPFKLDEVRAALIAAGVGGLTVTEVKGFGRQRGHHHISLAADTEVYFVPKLMLEIVVEDEVAPQIVELVRAAAVTGKVGDGKVWVQSVTSATRIRTGETGREAL